jgi:GNAT superfamily N-acetyltransferase
MSDSRASYPLIDLSLARRLERTEASANAAFVTGRAQLQPESGATWTDVAGALPPAPAGKGLRVRRIGADEAELWAQVAAQGWSSESPDLVPFILEMGKISARAEGTFCFLAELEGQPVAAGGLSLSEGTALLAGASTIPAARRKGAQRALLEARLRFAAEQGCDLVMIGASPGSASQRNAERQGFRVAYTRIKWHLRPPSA